MQYTHHEEGVVRALHAAPRRKLDVWQLTRKVGYLLDTIKAVERLRRVGVVTAGNSIVVLADAKGVPAYVLKKEKPLLDVVRVYVRLRHRARFANVAFDQLMIEPSAIHNKLALMQKRGDLLNKDILCIGDDDLFSVACALTGLPRSVTALDADESVLAYIRSISPRLPIPVQTIHHNLINPIPKRYYESFDVFVTEPPETIKATLLFVMQGLRVLRKRGAFHLGMTEVTLGSRDHHAVEKALLEAGAVITDILHDCEEYAVEGNELTSVWGTALPAWVSKLPRSPWFVSTLFRGEVVTKKRLKLPSRVTKKDLSTEV